MTQIGSIRRFLRKTLLLILVLNGLVILAAWAVGERGLNLLATGETELIRERGAELYGQYGCIGCHGEGGRVSALPAYPIVAGQSVVYLSQQMRDIRDGERTNGLSQLMQPYLLNMTDEEIKLVAQYLSQNQP